MTGAQLYRHFDADGVLLYVGISLSHVARLGQHMCGSGWAEEIARIDVQPFESREEALAAERLAINKEKPRYNIVGARMRAAPPPLDPLQRYTVKETMSYLRICRAHLYKHIRSGALRVLKDGSRTYIPGTEIQRLSRVASS